MARAGRALAGIFGEMLEKLLRSPKQRVPARMPSHSVDAPATARAKALDLAKHHMMQIRAERVKRASAAAAAVDVRTGRSYTGRIAEGVPIPTNLRQRLPSPSLEPRWESANCAEVSAAAKALNDGSQLDDLVIMTVDKNGEIFKPCANCSTWVPHGGME